MAFAKAFKEEHNKPKGTHISRIPQGVEDGLFKSYFEDFYAPVVSNYSEGGNLDTKKNQDVAAEVFAKEKKAAQLTLDRLGGKHEF